MRCTYIQNTVHQILSELVKFYMEDMAKPIGLFFPGTVYIYIFIHQNGSQKKKKKKNTYIQKYTTNRNESRNKE